jgi:hypothetical protein
MRLGQKKLTWMDKMDRMQRQDGFEIWKFKSQIPKLKTENRKLKTLPILSILSIHVNNFWMTIPISWVLI